MTIDIATAKEVTTIIAQIGFPIVVALWFMLRMERIITANTAATQGLTESIILLRGELSQSAGVRSIARDVIK